MPSLKPESGYVYFIQAADGGPVKIGWAKDPAARLLTLQCGNPQELVIRSTRFFDDAIMAEQNFHKLFWQLRVRGEWFNANPLLCDIGQCIPDDDAAPIDALDLSQFNAQRFSALEVIRDGYAEDKAAQRAAREERDASLSTDLDRSHQWTKHRGSLTVIPDEYLEA